MFRALILYRVRSQVKIFISRQRSKRKSEISSVKIRKGFVIMDQSNVTSRWVSTDSGHRSQPHSNESISPPTATVAATGNTVKAPSAITSNIDPVKFSENLKGAVKMLNQQMVDSNRGLNFSYDKTIAFPIVEVKNSNTGEVVRQIPSKELVSLAHNLEDLRGLLYNRVV